MVIDDGKRLQPAGVAMASVVVAATALAGAGVVGPDVTRAATDRGVCQVWSKTPPAASPTNVSPQIDLVSERLSVSSDGRTLHVVMTVANMSEKLPPATTEVRWMATWGYGSTAQAVAAILTVGGGVRYVDGTFVVGSGYNPGAAISVKHVDTGSFVTGVHGSVEIDVPLANLAPIRLGSRLQQPVAATDAWAEADYPVFDGPAFVSEPYQDQGGPDADYVMGRGCGPASPHAARARAARSASARSALGVAAADRSSAAATGRGNATRTAAPPAARRPGRSPIRRRRW